MPIDARIPLGAEVAKIDSPFVALSQIATLQAQRAQAEERAAAAQAAAATRAQQARVTQAVNEAYVPDPARLGRYKIDRDKLAALLPGSDRYTMDRQIDEDDKKEIEFETARETLETKRRESLASQMGTVAALGHDPTVWKTVIDRAERQGTIDPETAAQMRARQTPDTIKPIAEEYIRLARGKTTDKLQKVTRYNPVTKQTEEVFVDPKEGEAFLQPPKAADEAKHSPIYQEWQDYQSTGGTLSFDAYMTQDANRRRAVTHVNTGQATDADVDQYVSGVIDGTLPPELPGRASPLRTKILAELHRRGFDLATAATDWMATAKHIQTMNGAQQLRLNQAVNALPEMLNSVESLAKQWKAGGFPALNRAQLALAKSGTLGPKAAGIANQLDAQIADVVADLGNVYMGGNSPTDHALSLAGKSLSAEWSEPVLLQMVALAKKNVQIRRNSINSTGVAGASAENPYVAAPPPSPLPDTGAAKPFTVKTPDGKIWGFDTAAQLAAFKKRAGIP